MRFVDTNVLLYTISVDERERAKTDVANELTLESGLAVSVQVLQEFYVHATRRTRSERLDHDLAVQLLETFTGFHVVDNTLAILRRALATGTRFGISYWDAAVIEAAREARCDVVLSEDLSDGQDYDGVEVVNPFAAAV